MADKIYTLKEIDQLNLERKAVYDKVYADVNGDKYIGTKRGTVLAGGKTSPIVLSDAAKAATGVDTLDEVIAQRIGRLYETVVDFGAPNFDEEETEAEWVVFTPDARLDNSVSWDFPFSQAGISERDPEDAALEELSVQVTNIVPEERIQGIVHAPNGAFGRYRLRLKIA